MQHGATLDSIRQHAEANGHAPPALRPAAPPRATQVCPYCGHREHADSDECSSCRGLFEPLSRIATQNAMGPWQIRDEANPFRPGCSIETLRALIRRGKLSRETVLRGPSTRQFWARAAEIQGVAHLLGLCHACGESACPDDHLCSACGASFVPDTNRNWMGLDAVRPIGPVAAQTTQTTEPKDAPVAAPVSPAIPFAPNPGAPANAFVDLFAGQPVGPAPAGALPAEAMIPSPTLRREVRERRQRVRAARHAVAAATVALCAAALSVAVWAASAARVVGSSPAQAAGAQTPVVDEQGGATAPDIGLAPGVTPESPIASEPALTPEERAAWQVRIDSALALGESEDADAVAEAVDLLREIERTAPEGIVPPDFGDAIERLERRLDDLTIRKFLRDGR